MRFEVAASVLIGSLLVAAPAWGEIRLGSPFSRGAVLQRERPVPVWGWANPGEMVTVQFAGQTQSASAATNGAWSVTLTPLAASFAGQTLVVSTATERKSVADILVGEVWFASGQSNMECPIKGPSPRFRDGQGRLAIAMTREPGIRFFKVKKGWEVAPQPTTPYGWYRFTPEDFAKINDRPSLSAVAFYFALEVFHGAKVPVGIIEASVGGTNIDAWTPRSGLVTRPDLKDVAAYPVKKDWHGARDAIGAISGPDQQPTVLWNAMVAPFAPYALRGLIWYQGCHNADEPQRYLSKMHALYAGWTTEFRNPDLALYFVELAPYKTSWFDIQQAQHRFAEEERHAAIAISCDVGNPNDVHHNEKRTVARRLAAHALKRLYGFASLEDESPRPKTATAASDGTVTLTFDHAQKLYFYNIPRTRPDGFELAGADGKWHSADVTNAEAGRTAEGGVYYPGLFLQGARHVELRSVNVPKPLKLRYLHEKPWTGCLYNESDLPLGSFQTDVTPVDTPWTRRQQGRRRLYERAAALATKDKLLEAELAEFRRSLREDEEFHRLDPRNPAVSARVLSVREFGARGDDATDNTPAFAAASAAVRQLRGEPVIVDIPPGVYRFRTEVAPVLGKPVQVDFSGLTNCYLRGAGPERTEFVFCLYDRSGVSLNKSENTTLEGVSCRYLENPFAQCEILSFDPAKAYADVKAEARTLRPDDARFRRGENPLVCGVYDAHGRKIVDEGGAELFFTRQAESLGDGRYRVHFTSRSASAARAESLKGAIVVLPDRDNALQGLNTFLSSRCTCANVWFRNARSSTITGFGARYFTMIGCRVVPLPGLVFSANADSGYCERGATILDCDFGGNNDDGANCFGRGVQIVERTGPRTLKIHPFPIPPARGDVVRIVCALDGTFLADLTVASVRGDILEFVEEVPPSIVAEKTCGALSATDRRNVSLGLGKVRAAADIIYAPMSRGVGFLFVGNRIHDLRGNGVNVQASHALVSGNRFENLAQGIKLSGLNNWFEGPPPSDVVIERNAFVNCRCAIASVYTDVNARSAAENAITDILFSDNRFEGVVKVYNLLNTGSLVTGSSGK